MLLHLTITMPAGLLARADGRGSFFFIVYGLELKLPPVLDDFHEKSGFGNLVLIEGGHILALDDFVRAFPVGSYS